jgi:hypothetical protein
VIILNLKTLFKKFLLCSEKKNILPSQAQEVDVGFVRKEGVFPRNLCESIGLFHRGNGVLWTLKESIFFAIVLLLLA